MKLKIFPIMPAPWLLFPSMFPLYLLFLSLSIHAQPPPSQAKPGRELRAGAATSNITPWLGLSINGNMQDVIARHIHDELHARCLVLDDGTQQLAIVIVDSCMAPREIFDQAKQIIFNRTGLPPAHILMAATHTHSAPSATPVFQSDPDPEYQAFLVRRIADGVQRALNHLEPARIGWARGEAPDQVFNRRWHMNPETVLADPFGGAGDQVKMNPPIANPALVKPAGPIDPELAILSIQSASGRPLALLANYSLHYCGGTGPGHVSADYFGMFALEMEKKLEAHHQDPPFVGMMSNGASGDINNINFRIPQPSFPPYGRMRHVAQAVSEEAWRVYHNIEYKDWIPLHAAQREITLGVRLPSPEDLERAREILETATQPVLRTLPEIYARETVLLSQYPANVDLILQAFRIGDLAIAAIPCEVFAEIGLELKKTSPFPQTFTISLANGYNGYLPTVRHHELGGYETWRARSSYLEIEAEPKVTQTLRELFQELKTK
jgi:neutral ceramidase